MYATTNFTGTNLTIKDNGGDAIYMGRIGGAKAYCENIVLENIVMDNNRRQGISLISGRNIECKNIKVTNTDGVEPQDGIDIEPNNADEFLDNILLENIYTEGNSGSGIKFFLNPFTSATAPISITIRNHKDVGSDYGLRFRRCDGVSGQISISNVNYSGAVTREFSFEDFGDQVNTVIDGMTITSENTIPCQIGSGTATVTRSTGNLKIKNLKLKAVSGGTTYSRPLYFYAANTPEVVDVDIEVSEIDDPVIANAHVGFDTGVYRNITIRDKSPRYGATTATFSSSGDVLRTYSAFRHKTRVINTGTNDAIITNIKAGTCTTIENGQTSGSNTITAGGAAIKPGTTSHVLTLSGPGSWATVERDADDDTIYRVIDGQGYKFVLSAVPTVASAAALTLPTDGEIISVTGTTNITSVVATGNINRRVTLVFTGILTFTDGSNLKLNGNFVTTADDTITLICDGTNWYEIARSTN